MAKNEIMNNDALTVRVNEEPVVEAVEQVVEATRNNPYILAGVAVVSLGAGVAIGYQIAKRKMALEYEKQIDERVEHEADRIRQFYGRMAELNETEATTIDPVVDDAARAMNEYSGREVPTTIVESEAVQVTETVVLEPDDMVWNYDHELAYRETLKMGTPYVISHDEFMQGEPEYEQTTLTWYVSDNALADDKDELIPDTDKTVGEANLFRFGHGSNDDNVVYIRNDRLRLDFEVVKSEGSYQAEVLGELMHTEDQRILRRRRRGTDE